MKFKNALMLIFTSFSGLLVAQMEDDPWISEQLGDISWYKTYTGMLAEFHPVTIELASDGQEVAGYLIHQGDNIKHRISGEWSENRLFQLQERDDHDRLSGYLTGSIKDDQLALKWLSVMQDRVFDIHASSEKMINLHSSAPAAEWVLVSSEPALVLSIQKTAQGKVFGLVLSEDRYIRFEGTCLDGSCSIWKATCRDSGNKEINIQMTQKTPSSYKAIINSIPNSGTILYQTPLETEQEDNSNGFFDFTYPRFESEAYMDWVDSFQVADQLRLTDVNQMDVSSRLSYRSSGWVEIVDETETYISGLVTFINPEGGARKSFILLKKDGTLLQPISLLNEEDDLSAISDLALAAVAPDEDDVLYTWLTRVGYTTMVPTQKGLLLTTMFNAVYGDEMRLLSIEESKKHVRKKYWKFFGW